MCVCFVLGDGVRCVPSPHRYGEPVSLRTKGASRPARPLVELCRVGSTTVTVEGIYQQSLSTMPPNSFFFEMTTKAAPDWGGENSVTATVAVAPSTTAAKDGGAIREAHTFEGLSPNFQYIVRFRARNPVGWSSWSRPLQVRTNQYVLHSLCFAFSH